MQKMLNIFHWNLLILNILKLEELWDITAVVLEVIPQWFYGHFLAEPLHLKFISDAFHVM